MRKTLWLLVGLMFITQMTAFAEINRSVNDDRVVIESKYTTIYQEEGAESSYDCNLVVYLSRIYIANIFCIDETFELNISGWSSFVDKKPQFAFSKNNPVKLEIVKDGEVSLVAFEKLGGMSNHSISYRFDKKVLNIINEADKVVLLIPGSNNEVKRIAIPEEISAEWQYILNEDMCDVKKEY